MSRHPYSLKYVCRRFLWQHSKIAERIWPVISNMCSASWCCLSITVFIYVGHLESKERLRIHPAQLFRVWTVAWCSSCCKLFHVVRVIGWNNERADIKSHRLWGARRDSVFAGRERQTLWNSPKTCCGLWRTCYKRGQCPKMVHNVYEWANRCSWR